MTHFPLTKLVIAIATLASLSVALAAEACTYVRLTGADGSQHPGRTMEWGTFDIKPGFSVIPRGHEHSAMTMPDGSDGAKWNGKYGYAGVSLLERDGFFGDVINEKGLVMNLLYFPGFAEYQPYDPAQAANSISATDYMTYMASQFATVQEVIEATNQVRIVPVIEPSLGFAAPVHVVVSDPSGDEIVVEYINGELHIFEETIGVMTNSPPYNWHLTNLRNYLNLRPVNWPDIEVAGLTVGGIGYGTGLLGLPGDYTPPSRFIRATAYKETARETQGAYDTTLEHFRILGHFQLPLETDFSDLPDGLDPIRYGSTQYTVSFDTANMQVYYFTDDEARVRKFDLKQIEWDTLSEPMTRTLRRGGPPQVEEVMFDN
ncbi:linear amide C-N hydrolase [Ruegeria sp. HKCCA5491]|uniref:linear amide C-N hydrolase n=1 Tax=Ruegeria sp. HKCCA5491 TaxID=2682986 RepID=UPI001489E4B4|nr:linear amide C-N hydrolase [Ruegeria sp. HKCCA5491]